jgi:hypothetical protein
LAALTVVAAGVVQPSADYYVAILEVGYINFYELNSWRAEEELEALGWALGGFNAAAAAIVSALLSVACVCAVSLVALGRRARVVFRPRGAALSYGLQSIRLQEAGAMGAPRRASQFFHRRRA